MKLNFCPRCNSKNIIFLTEDNYKCLGCGYIGNLQGKGILKK